MSTIRKINQEGEVESYDQPEKPVGKTPEESKFEHALGQAPSVDEMAVQQVMGLDNEKEKGKYKREVGILLDWAKTQTDSKDPMTLKWTIRQLQMKLGTPNLSEKMIVRAARFAYLDMESKKIDKEKLSLMG